MRHLLTFYGVIPVICLIILISCKENENNNATNISKHGLTESHNIGLNCMNCHKSGGEGKGWFTAAGTIYDSSGVITNPNGTVNLYSGPNGTGSLVKSIEVDAKGNFYTTESIDFTGTTIYPSVTGTAGKTKHMPTSISSGACNNCHTGSPTLRIWVY